MTTYDTVIRGGHVIDPASGLTEVADVAITGGTIAAVEAVIHPSAAREVIDATGTFVTPGLIDLHTHVYWGVTYWGIEPDPVAARTGVTTWLDVGSAGSYSFPGFRRFICEPSRSRIFALLNLSSIGLIAPSWEFANPDYWDVDLAATIVEDNRDLILGIKARIDSSTTRGVGVQPLARAREVADRVGLPLMTHIGVGPPSLDEVAEYLRPGDMLTHCFTGHSMRILTADGRIHPTIKRLHEEGLILDIGHGAGSFSFETSEAMLAQGVMPDVISSDIHQLSIQGPMFDLPTTLSKFLGLGMSVADVIECATAKPAAAMRRPDLGTLRPGSKADIALFRIEEGNYTFQDIHLNERHGSQRLINTMTFLDGERMPLDPERPLMPWAKLTERQAAALKQP